MARHTDHAGSSCLGLRVSRDHPNHRRRAKLFSSRLTRRRGFALVSADLGQRTSWRSRCSIDSLRHVLAGRTPSTALKVRARNWTSSTSSGPSSVCSGPLPARASPSTLAASRATSRSARVRLSRRSPSRPDAGLTGTRPWPALRFMPPTTCCDHETPRVGTGSLHYEIPAPGRFASSSRNASDQALGGLARFGQTGRPCPVSRRVSSFTTTGAPRLEENQVFRVSFGCAQTP